MKQLDEHVFDGVTRLTELIMRSKELKRQGYNEMEVNTLVSKKKRELRTMSSAPGVQLLEKKTPVLLNISKQYYSVLPVNIENIGSNTLRFDGSEIII